MKVNSIQISHYYGDPSGNIVINDESTSLSITLTPEEAHELMSVGLRIFEKRQKSIARSIADMKVVALPAPGTPDAEFTEVDDAAP